MDITAEEYSLSNLRSINVILGKNGSGKSRLLTKIETASAGASWGVARYITPERGGVLTRDTGVETNIVNPEWVAQTRRVNQLQQFKQQSVSQFNRLRLLVYERSETEQTVANFQPYVARINDLLDNIELVKSSSAFDLRLRSTGEALTPQTISSGESELISLAIEILMFSSEQDDSKDNWLLLDEPDVHLHPDLQYRLMSLVRSLADEHDFKVIIATHSTAILGALSDFEDAAVAFMRPNDKTLEFEVIDDVMREVLPVFGAHPLSNVFNDDPILLVEGEDDVRVWQQAVRTSAGGVGVYPVSCDGVSSLSEYESKVRRIVSSVYDDPKALSLRDGDGVSQQLDDDPPVIRMRLSCFSAENLILSNEVLQSVGTSWDETIQRMDEWLETHDDHSRRSEMEDFKSGGYDRKGHDLKKLRVILTGGVLNSDKPWEVLVGQVLGQLTVQPDASPAAGSIEDFLGAKVVENVFAGVSSLALT